MQSAILKAMQYNEVTLCIQIMIKDIEKYDCILIECIVSLLHFLYQRFLSFSPLKNMFRFREEDFVLEQNQLLDESRFVSNSHVKIGKINIVVYYICISSSSFSSPRPTMTRCDTNLCLRSLIRERYMVMADGRAYLDDEPPAKSCKAKMKWWVAETHCRNLRIYNH